MKITRKYLQRIIKEEAKKVRQEGSRGKLQEFVGSGIGMMARSTSVPDETGKRPKASEEEAIIAIAAARTGMGFTNAADEIERILNDASGAGVWDNAPPWSQADPVEFVELMTGRNHDINISIPFPEGLNVAADEEIDAAYLDEVSIKKQSLLNFINEMMSKVATFRGKKVTNGACSAMVFDTSREAGCESAPYPLGDDPVFVFYEGEGEYTIDRDHRQLEFSIRFSDKARRVKWSHILLRERLLKVATLIEKPQNYKQAISSKQIRAGGLGHGVDMGGGADSPSGPPPVKKSPPPMATPAAAPAVQESINISERLKWRRGVHPIAEAKKHWP